MSLSKLPPKGTLLCDFRALPSSVFTQMTNRSLWPDEVSSARDSAARTGLPSGAEEAVILQIYVERFYALFGHAVLLGGPDIGQDRCCRSEANNRAENKDYYPTGSCDYLTNLY